MLTRMTAGLAILGVCSSLPMALPKDSEPMSDPDSGHGIVKEGDYWTRVLLHGTIDEKMRIAEQLGNRQELDALPCLIMCLNDPDPNVRAWCAWALAKLGDKRAVEPLIRAFEKYDTISNCEWVDWEGKCLPDFALALEKLTGKHFGLDIKKWKELLHE